MATEFKAAQLIVRAHLVEEAEIWALILR